MTISSTTAKNTFAGNGSTTVFAYTFRILDEDEILVQIKVDATEVTTTQTITTDYTVSGVGDSAGGNITMVVAPATGETLILTRNTALLQEIDYTENDAFPAETHETGLDRLTTITQQLDEAVDRSVKVDSTVTGFDVLLPDPTANKFIRYNAAADGWEAIALSTVAGLADVVDDPTPQLGGNLDTNGKNINVATGDKVVLAGSASLDMTGTSTITVGTGSTFIFEGSTADDFETTLTVIDPTADRVWSLPDATDTATGKATTDTLTNKTIDADGTGNVITNVGSSEIKSELITGQSDTAIAAGDSIIYSDTSDSDNLKKDTVQGILDLVSGLAIDPYISGFQMTNAADASHDIIFGSGQVVDSATSFLITHTSTLEKRFDANWVAGATNGGMASGATGLAADGTVHMFAISTDAGLVDFIGDDNVAGTNVSADVSGGGYDNVEYIGSLLLNSSSNFIGFTNRVSGTMSTFKYDNGVSDFNGLSPTVNTLITLTVPVDIELLALMRTYSAQIGTTQFNWRMYEVDGTDTAPANSTNAIVTNDSDGTTALSITSVFDVFTDTSGQARHRGTAAETVRVSTLGYTLYR